MPGCATCPPPVKAVLRRRVNKDLARVRAVKEMTTALNRLLTELVDKATADLIRLIRMVEAIPEPVIDITELINWLTCPLLPVAILEDPSIAREAFEALDPRKQIALLKRMVAAYVDDLQNIYYTALRTLESYDLVKMAQKYIDELKRIDLDAESFARSVIITATVSGLGEADDGCKAEFFAGPYNEFVEEISNFSFTGLYTEGFDANVQAVMDELARAEAKFAGWRLVIVTGL